MLADIPMALLMWTWADPAPVHELIRLVEPAQPDWHQLEEQFPDCPVTTELKLWVCEIEQKMA